MSLEQVVDGWNLGKLSFWLLSVAAFRFFSFFHDFDVWVCVLAKVAFVDQGSNLDSVFIVVRMVFDEDAVIILPVSIDRVLKLLLTLRLFRLMNYGIGEKVRVLLFQDAASTSSRPGLVHPCRGLL